MRLVVGRIGRAHGLAGEVGVEVRTDEPEVRFANGAILHGADRSLQVAASRWHSGRLLVRFAGCDDRTDAEALRGIELAVDIDESALPHEPDAYYDHQLIGLAVVLTDGTPAGEIADVLHLPSQDLLAVQATDGREVLIPFVAQIVPEIDLVARRVTVDPPGGLFEPED